MSDKEAVVDDLEEDIEQQEEEVQATNKAAMATATTTKTEQEDGSEQWRLHGRLAWNENYGVSKFTAMFVLFFALLASAFYFVGQIAAMWGIGATVRLDLDDGTFMTKSYAPYEMSLMFSLKACIKTGLAPEVILGVILFFFSGVWPHAKLWLMLYCWFGDISHRFRGIVLYWLGAFGKFSFADPLIVAVLMVAFTIKVTIGPGDFLFNLAANAILSDIDEGGSADPSSVESMTFALDIVSFRGIYFFCGGVWLSLFLGGVVEHYQRHLILEHLNSSNQGLEKPHPFRAKAFWLSGLATLPILAFLIVSVVLPLLEKRINGVLPFLITGFGWIADPELAPITESIDYATLLEYVLDVRGSGAKFMAATVILFVLIMPFLRAPVLDVMWLPHGMTKQLTSKLYLMYSITSLLDSLPVFLFAVILVHFEIDAIAEQIAFPFCGDIAAVAGIVDNACQNFGGDGFGPIDFFTNHPFAERTVKDFLSNSDLAANITSDLQGRCTELEASSNSFTLSDCLSINLDFDMSMWCVTVAVILIYASSMLLAYAISIELLGPRFFEAPVAYLPGGWCCCGCCSGSVPAITDDGGEDDNDDVPTSTCTVGVEACSHTCRNCCWCWKSEKKDM